MTQVRRSSLKKRFNQKLRQAFHVLPVGLRFYIYRWMVDCDHEPDRRLELKIAETQEELEDCFRILHDAYVGSGFMKPDPSGMRITKYHALPTTTTLCAKFDGQVVGTISMIREGVFGFPLQSAFDLSKVREKGGQIAEISALAVHPSFRKTGGSILFPLMKFMHEYCTEFFDTRHLVIAVNPDRIELYEALLFFERLQSAVVQNYDFANGAPAIGATLDLHEASEIFRRAYKGRPTRKNMHKYFFQMKLENIKLPKRRYYTTNDPVMTPRLLDYFFNEKSQVFDELDDRRKSLLWSIYGLVEYRSVLPMLQGNGETGHPLRQHQRYSLRCPATLQIVAGDAAGAEVGLDVIELSLSGFQAVCRNSLTPALEGDVVVDLGFQEKSSVHARVVRTRSADGEHFIGFKIDEPDRVWRRCVAALELGQTSEDLMVS